MFYEFKTEEKIPKVLRDYQMPLELFENLRDGNLNPKEILKNQVKFKLHLNKTKIGSNKSEDQKNIRNIIILFNWRRKVIQLFRDYSLLLSEAKCKAKHGEELKILMYCATFKMRKSESLFYKINTFLQKTAIRIRLQAEPIFYVNI